MAQELEEMMAKEKPDVLILTETKIDDSITKQFEKLFPGWAPCLANLAPSMSPHNAQPSNPRLPHGSVPGLDVLPLEAATSAYGLCAPFPPLSPGVGTQRCSTARR